jgi:hypothetical protein
MFHFHLLHARFLLLAMPLVAFMAYMLYRGYIKRSQARKAYGDEDLLSRYSATLTITHELRVMAAWITVALLLAVVVAMPVSSDVPSRISSGSTKVVAVVDVSPSMAAEDHRDKFPAVDGKPPLQVLGPYGRRIDEVQLALEDQIMPALAGNELGIVLFEGDAKDQVDLDDDFQKIRWEFANNWLGIGQAPGDGSDYGKGLAMALSVFKNSTTPGKNKVIVLFSDGGSDGLDRKALAKTIEKIKAENIKVIVVAVGGEKEMKVNSYNAQGVAVGYVKLEGCDDRGSEGDCQTRLNMKELSGLATNFNTQPLVLDVGAKLPIEWAKVIAGSKAENRPDHLYRVFLVPCLILVLLLQLRGIFTRRNDAD